MSPCDIKSKTVRYPHVFGLHNLLIHRAATRKIKTYVTATLCDRGNTAAALYLLVAVDFGDPTAAVENVT